MASEVIGFHWLPKIKTLPSSKIDKNNSRLVAQGFIELMAWITLRLLV